MYKCVNEASEKFQIPKSSKSVQYCNVFSCRYQKEKKIGQEL